MAFFFSRRKLRPSADEESTELNIVPYLDVLMNLIMFMLLSITGLATFGILNVSAPEYGSDSASRAEGTEAPQLLLRVLILDQGFAVGVSGPAEEAREESIERRADGSYDFASLNARMVSIKDRHPQQTGVILAAEGRVSYDVLVKTMDAVRETAAPPRRVLFPDVTLAGK